MNDLQRDSYAKEAHWDGRMAYRSGLPDTSCDRTPGTIEHACWHIGYASAQAIDKAATEAIGMYAAAVHWRNTYGRRG